MATKTKTATQAVEPTEATEPKKERKPKDVQYGTRMVLTFRAHKTVKTLPNIVPGILSWAESNGLVAESETFTTTQKEGKKDEAGNTVGKPKGSPLPFPKVEITFDTKDSFAVRKAAGTSGMDRETASALRNIVNDPDVIAKAKELGISTAELVKRAQESLKKQLLG